MFIDNCQSPEQPKSVKNIFKLKNSIEVNEFKP